MANGLTKAEFWRDFVVQGCGYPDQRRLAAQFDAAELTDFCDCGCNSFAVVQLNSSAPLLVREQGRGGTFFEADFLSPNGNSLEIILQVGADGRLNYVEVDHNVNSSPVPDDVSAYRLNGTHYDPAVLASDDVSSA